MSSPLANGAMSSAEKPFHYNYLRDFRTQQCPLFQQHKCTQHRPFTCFHYHFANQRRRRPRKKKENMFNYSPDIYCTVYDEATGACKNGDDCPYLHRVAGDVERRYHLRYYKTAMCVYETDARGYCVKNGAHCAYSHGPDDLRQPVFDSHTDPSASNQSLSESSESMKVGSMDSGSGLGSPRPRSYSGSSVRSDKSSAFDDQRWQDAVYVLVYYKTDLCPKPARACRQGYACPYFHNARDRRRSPKASKYRSTPCPSVKHGDEWGDPTQCENGDACQYCHSRTEQQFHPEIYKSTRCNDMLQTNQCPRGPFCAFAHYDQELCSAREALNEASYIPAFSQSPSSTGAPSLPSSLPSAPVRPSSLASPGFGSPVSVSSDTRAEESPQQQAVLRKQLLSIEHDASMDATEKAKRKQYLLQHRVLSAAAASPDNLPASSSSFASVTGGGHGQGHGLSLADTSVSMSGGHSSSAAMHSHMEHLVGASLDDLNMDSFEGTELEREINSHATGRNSMRDGFMGLGYGSGLDIFSQGSVARSNSSGSAPGSRQADLFDSEHRSSLQQGNNNNGLPSLAPMRSPYLSTVQQHLPSLTGRPTGDQAGAARMSSSVFSAFNGPSIGLSNYFGAEGEPTEGRDSRLRDNLSRGGGGSIGHGHSNAVGPSSSSRSGSGSTYPFGAAASSAPTSADAAAGFAKAIGSHRSGMAGGVDPLPLPAQNQIPVGTAAEQMAQYKRHVKMWETSWSQARAACEAWRSEVEAAMKKIQTLEDRCEAAVTSQTKAEDRVKELQASMSSSQLSDDTARGPAPACTGIHRLEADVRLGELPADVLKGHLEQLHVDQQRLTQVLADRQSLVCMLCKEERRNIVTEPCMHCVMCARCAAGKPTCPYCTIAHTNTICIHLPPPS